MHVNKGDIDEFNIQWRICQGFLRKTEQWETHVKHPMKHLKVSVIFPQSRPPQSTVLIGDRRSPPPVITLYLVGVSVGSLPA